MHHYGYSTLYKWCSIELKNNAQAVTVLQLQQNYIMQSMPDYFSNCKAQG